MNLRRSAALFGCTLASDIPENSETKPIFFATHTLNLAVFLTRKAIRPGKDPVFRRARTARFQLRLPDFVGQVPAFAQIRVFCILKECSKRYVRLGIGQMQFVERSYLLGRSGR